MTRDQFISHVESSQKTFRRFIVALCCGDSALADDIAQESLIKAYLSCDDLDNHDKFNSWIYRIGYNTFLNYKRSARHAVSYDEARNIPSDELSDKTFKYQDLYSALNRLSDKERTSILLYYMDDYTIKEISDIVGASSEAVKQQLSRGRKNLRTLLQQLSK